MVPVQGGGRADGGDEPPCQPLGDALCECNALLEITTVE
jgi:hypothetical protein